MAQALTHVADQRLANIRLHHGDALEVLQRVPDGGLTMLYLLHPDPWPKARHHRRRFVTPEHLIPLARLMKPGAEFRVATDIPDYMRQTLEEVPRTGFDLVAETPKAWDDWISTRYEQKALREGRVPHYATFRR